MLIIVFFSLGVSFVFLKKVKKLKQDLKLSKASEERSARHQKITAEFSRSLEPKNVGDAIVFHGMESLAARSGSVLILSEDQEHLEILSEYGYTSDRPQKTFINDISNSFIAIPLKEGADVIGALNFSFEDERKFTPEERSFVAALADLAAQALQRARLYSDAQKAVQVRDNFISIASHELKTPITSLKMQIQLAQRRIKANDDIVVWQRSLVQVDRLTSLIDALLDVSRISAGKLYLNPIKFDLYETLKTVLTRFEVMLEQSKCTIEVSGDRSVWMWGDPCRLEQVIVNLLSNAIKYAPGKPIQVLLIQKSESVELSIRDRGIGIPPEKHEYIFDRFERCENRHNISGLGLGLYIVREFVEAHEGTVRVVSNPEDGTTFVVDLPLAL